MRLRPLRLIPALVLVLGPLAGCGGDDASIANGLDGGTDATSDGTTNDATTTDTGTSDTGVPDNVTNDTGGGDSGDAGACGSLTPRKACVDCCGMANMAGRMAYDKAILDCGCQSDVCGALDGGASDGGSEGGADAGGEGGVLGNGACTATCTLKTMPDMACNMCLRDSVGTKQNPGVCYNQVVTACMADTACVAYVMCLGTCP